MSRPKEEYWDGIVLGWASWMEIIQLPWIIMSVQARERAGVMLRQVAASKANTWQTGWREMLTSTVVMHGMIALFHAIMRWLKIYLA